MGRHLYVVKCICCDQNRRRSQSVSASQRGDIGFLRSKKLYACITLNGIIAIDNAASKKQKAFIRRVWSSERSRE